MDAPAFFVSDGDGYRATVATRGPWDAGFQHGGPPSALLVRAMRLAVGDPALALATFSSRFLRAVPLARVSVEVTVSVGRTVARTTAVLHADRPVLEAQGLFVRTQPAEVPTCAEALWPAPEACAPFAFSFFPWEEGYHRGVEFRCLPEERWGGPTLRTWARPRLPLVAGTPTTAEEATVLLADAESGMAPPLDPSDWTFANPDLTVVFGRAPVGPWIGFAAESRTFASGRGLAEARLRDGSGVFGRSVQSLLVRGR